MSKLILKELKELNRGKRGIFENMIYRHFSIHITSILIHTNVTPNFITSVSLFLAFIAAIFYFKADYTSLIIGTVLLNISYLLDEVDGELARYKKLNSSFGAWWDSTGDRITEYVIISSLTLGLYFKTTNPAVLVLGLFALANDLMICNIRLLNWFYFNDKSNRELFLGKKYLEHVATFTVLVTIATLFNQVYYFLWVYSVLGLLVWVRQIYRSVKHNFKSSNIS